MTKALGSICIPIFCMISADGFEMKKEQNGKLKINSQLSRISTTRGCGTMFSWVGPTKV